MSATFVVSVELGGLFQPVNGADKPQIFLRRVTRRLISKSFDDTVGEMSVLHCVGLMAFIFFMDVNVAFTGAVVNTVWRLPGGYILSNVSLNTCVPTSTNKRHNRA